MANSKVMTFFDNILDPMRGLEDYQLLGWDPYNKPMHQKPHKPEDSKVIEQVAVT